MKRREMRKSSVDNMKSMCREINTLKAELFEIKSLIKNMCKDKK
jgi:ribosomal protein L29